VTISKAPDGDGTHDAGDIPAGGDAKIIQLPARTDTVTPVTPFPLGPYPTAARLKADGWLDGWTERDGCY
jgi:hypothetical protein